MSYSKGSADTIHPSVQQTAQSTILSVKEMRRLWSRLWPTSGLFQWPLMPPALSLSCTAVVSISFLLHFYQTDYQFSYVCNNVFSLLFLYRYLTSVHHRNLQWPNLYKKSKPRSAGCGIRCACWTGLLAGQKQVQSEQLLRFAIINWLGMI